MMKRKEKKNKKHKEVFQGIYKGVHTDCFCVEQKENMKDRVYVWTITVSTTTMAPNGDCGLSGSTAVRF